MTHATRSLLFAIALAAPWQGAAATNILRRPQPSPAGAAASSDAAAQAAAAAAAAIARQ